MQVKVLSTAGARAAAFPAKPYRVFQLAPRVASACARNVEVPKE
nr:hypothetical protein [Sediminihaliea albiluteola]